MKYDAFQSARYRGNPRGNGRRGSFRAPASPRRSLPTPHTDSGQFSQSCQVRLKARLDPTRRRFLPARSDICNAGHAALHAVLRAQHADIIPHDIHATCGEARGYCRGLAKRAVARAISASSTSSSVTQCRLVASAPITSPAIRHRRLSWRRRCRPGGWTVRAAGVLAGHVKPGHFGRVYRSRPRHRPSSSGRSARPRPGLPPDRSRSRRSV